MQVRRKYTSNQSNVRFLMYELINTNKKQQSFTQQKSKHILNLGDYVTKKMKQLTSIA